MLPHKEEIESLKNQILNKYKLEKLYLFGSCSKGCIRKNSDIDLCVVMNVENKREQLADMYMDLESSVPFDIILYTPESWKEHEDDPGSFAHLIKSKGVLLYG